MKSYKKMVSSTKETARELYDAIKTGGCNDVDIVEEGNMNPVTSNAVARALAKLISETSTITITVKNDTTKEIIKEAEVTLGNTVQTTDNNGQTTFNDVKYGNYALKVTKTDFIDFTDSISVDTENYEFDVNLSPKSDADVGEIKFYCANEQGQNLSGIDVELDGNRQPTGDNGKCTFENMKYGEYTYTVSNENYETQTGTVTLNQDEVQVSLVMVVKKVSNVIFKVVTSSSGSAISGATVQFGDFTGTTGIYGTCNFKNIAIGQYNYSISNTGYNTISGTVQVDNDNYSFKFSLAQGSAVPAIIDDGGKETSHLVTLQYKNKKKANSYPIEIINASNNTVVAKGTTNNKGMFNFNAPSNVEHLICKVTMDTKNIGYYELGNSKDTSFNVTIPDEDRCNLTVKVDYGKGLYYSLVQLGNHEESTGEDKSCTFENLKYGTYDLTISTKYYFDYTDTITIDSTKKEYKAVLKPKLCDITVHVKNELTEDAIENATVTVNKETKTTNKDGNATFKLVKQDMVAIQGKHDNYEPNNIMIDANSETVEKTLYLTHNPSNVNFKVINQETKEPIQYAYIQLGNAIGESNKDGKYTFKNQEHGNYYLNVSAINHDEHLGDIDINSDEQEVTIELKPKNSNKTEDKKANDKENKRGEIKHDKD